MFGQVGDDLRLALVEVVWVGLLGCGLPGSGLVGLRLLWPGLLVCGLLIVWLRVAWLCHGLVGARGIGLRLLLPGLLVARLRIAHLLGKRLRRRLIGVRACLLGVWPRYLCLLGYLLGSLLRRLPHLVSLLLRRCDLGGMRSGHRDGDDRARVHVVLDGEGATVVLHVLLGIGKARPNAAYVALHLLRCRGGSILKRPVLLAYPRSLV